MIIQSQSLMFTPLFLLLSLLLFDIAFAQARVGEFQPINPNDPHVVEIGRYAVDTHNKQAHTNLQFLNVVEGKSQTAIPGMNYSQIVIFGINYNLTINVLDGGYIQTYVAFVYEPPGHGQKELKSFQSIRGKLGAFKSVDPRDPDIVETVHYAVDEYNKQANKSLAVKKVIAAQVQIVAGKNYKLTITVANGGIYEILVFKALNGQRTLKSFKAVVCIPGRFCPRDPDDPDVVEIGRYAVDEFNKQVHINLKFKILIEAETQVVAGIIYRLIITASYHNHVQNYQAVVYERAWEGFRSLMSFKPLV